MFSIFKQLSIVCALLSGQIETVSPDAVIKVAQETYDGHIQNINTYSGLLIKRELVDGKDTGYQYIEFKYRDNPRAIYMKFLKPASLQGREILYNGSEDVVVKRGGRTSPGLTITLDINSPLLTDKNRHTLNEIGIKVLSKNIVDKIKVEALLPGVKIMLYDAAKIDGRPAALYKMLLSPDTHEEANATAELAIDKELHIPIYYKGVDKQGRIIEEYLFRNIKLNVEFEDKDFEESNNEYGFKKYAP